MPTVLVVNDEPAQLALLAGLFRKDGLTVRTAAAGAEGLEKASGCDLVVLDLNLPDMPGLEVLERLRESGFQAPVLAVSATAPAARERARLEAARSQVLAPYRPVQVRQAVRGLLSGEPVAPTAGTQVQTVDAALDRLKAAGGPALVSKVVSLFLDKLPSSLETLKRAAEAQDYGLAERTAHSLKGSAGMLGDLRVQDLCQRLEEASTAHTLDPSGSDFTALKAALENLRERLEQERQ